MLRIIKLVTTVYTIKVQNKIICITIYRGYRYTLVSSLKDFQPSHG